MPPRRDRYLYAMGLRVLAPLYDPLVRWVFPADRRLKGEIARRVGNGGARRILDVGCGTGTLALLIRRQLPSGTVVGLDGDDRVLGIAARKSARERLAADWVRGFSDRLPHPGGSFDCAVTSLMLHHLTREQKLDTLREIHRVLKPGGTLCCADFDRPHTVATRAAAWWWQLVEDRDRIRDNLEGKLPALIEAAGFEAVQRIMRMATLFGTVSLFHAQSD